MEADRDRLETSLKKVAIERAREEGKRKKRTGTTFFSSQAQDRSSNVITHVNELLLFALISTLGLDARLSLPLSLSFSSNHRPFNCT